MKLLLGIANGKYKGLAIFDLSENLLDLVTIRRYRTKKVAEHISSFGIPSAIAVESEDIPKLAKDLAEYFGIPILIPDEDILPDFFAETLETYSYKNLYEKRALITCLYVFKKFKHIFRDIDELLLSSGASRMLIDKAKELVLHGKAENALDAVEKVNGFFELTHAHKTRIGEFLESERDYKELYEEAVKYIKELERRIAELEKKCSFTAKDTEETLSENGERIRELERKVALLEDALRKEKERSEILEEKLGILEEERFIEKKGLLPVVKIHEFSFEEISKIKSVLRIFKRPVAVELVRKDLKAAKYLAKLHPSIVIGDFPEEIKAVFLSAGIPVISESSLDHALVKFKRFYGISEKELKKVLHNESKKSLIEMLRAYRKRLL